MITFESHFVENQILIFEVYKTTESEIAKPFNGEIKNMIGAGTINFVDIVKNYGKKVIKSITKNEKK